MLMGMSGSGNHPRVVYRRWTFGMCRPREPATHGRVEWPPTGASAMARRRSCAAHKMRACRTRGRLVNEDGLRRPLDAMLATSGLVCSRRNVLAMGEAWHTSSLPFEVLSTT